MNGTRIREALREQLYGVNSHLHVLHALEGLDPRDAGTSFEDAPHTIFQTVHHMIYWQDIALERLTGQRPAPPAHAEEGWASPLAPEDESDWEAALASLAEGLRAIEALVADPDYDLAAVVDRGERTAFEELLMLQGHNSYHLGQIVQLRERLGSWPPPRGGDTW
jgi:uncharacterized damage-inducible protein DinB